MNRTTLHVGYLPRRKRPVLYESTDGVLTPLASFASDDAAERFEELLRRGLRWEEEGYDEAS